MGFKRPGLEFGMELAAEEPGMVLKFDDLDEVLIGRRAGNHQPLPRQGLFEGSIELVPMPVSLGNSAAL